MNAKEHSDYLKPIEEEANVSSAFLPITPSPTEASRSPIQLSEDNLQNQNPTTSRESNWNCDPSSKKFVLKPTPAQLGMRRKRRTDLVLPSSTIDTISTETWNETGLQTLTPITGSDIASMQSEKKHLEEVATPSSTISLNTPLGTPLDIDIDFRERFRLLPQFDYDNYKPSTQWSVLTPTECGQDSHDYSQFGPKSSDTLSADGPKSLVGNHFFGPDFNLAHFNGLYLNIPPYLS